MSTKILKNYLSAFVGLVLLLPRLSYGASSSAPPTITTSEFYQYVKEKIPQVPEFHFIQEQAKQMGIRIWLFGGTAAGFAHYIKWDLQRQKGDVRYQADRFDYDFTNIYRSTQDLDLVIDGNESQAVLLEHALKDKFQYVQGRKAQWEIRLLTQNRGDKLALLNNPDFLNQNSDSHSTGMIDVTLSDPHIVRDLKDWNSAKPFFLQDVLDGKLHYYFSNLHETTSRFEAGKNPPILSAIRYLTKAVQFELSLRDEDLKQIQKIIDQFDPNSVGTGYVGDWIEKNGKKLFQNAVNIEYAWNLIESLGLRTKLIHIKNNPDNEDSLAWWMNREPLRSYPLGKSSNKSSKPGKTAKQIAHERGLNELIVTHATRSFLAYESITMAHTGEPNVFVSRDNKSGENAAYGQGFYTLIGKEGLGALHIRFRVDPRAIEGIDFSLEKIHTGTESLDAFLFKNKKAFRVIPESLDLNLADYFEAITDEAFKNNDLGLLEKLKRKLKTQTFSVRPEELTRIKKILLSEIRSSEPRYELISEWFNFRLEALDSEFTKVLVESALAQTKNKFENHVSAPGADLAGKWFASGGASRDLEFSKKLLRNWQGMSSFQGLLQAWFATDISAKYPEFAKELILPLPRKNMPGPGENYYSVWAAAAVHQPAWQPQIDSFILWSIQKFPADSFRENYSAFYMDPNFKGDRSLLELSLKESSDLVHFTLCHGYAKKYLTELYPSVASRTPYLEKWLEKKISSSPTDKELDYIMHILNKEIWLDSIGLVEKVNWLILKRKANTEEIWSDYITKILANPKFTSREGVTKVLSLKSEALTKEVIAKVIFKNQYLPLKLWSTVDMNKYHSEYQAGIANAGADISKYPEIIMQELEYLLSDDGSRKEQALGIIRSALKGGEAWAQQSHLIRLLMAHGLDSLAWEILMSNPVWLKYTDLYLDITRRSEFMARLTYQFLAEGEYNVVSQSHFSHQILAATEYPEVLDIFMRLHHPAIEQSIVELIGPEPEDRPGRYFAHDEIILKNREVAKAKLFQYLLNYREYKPVITTKLNEFPIQIYPFLIEEAVKLYFRLNQQKSRWAPVQQLSLQMLLQNKAANISELTLMCGGKPSLAGMLAAIARGQSLYQMDKFKNFRPRSRTRSCAEILKKIN